MDAKILQMIQMTKAMEAWLLRLGATKEEITAFYKDHDIQFQFMGRPAPIDHDPAYRILEIGEKLVKGDEQARFHTVGEEVVFAEWRRVPHRWAGQEILLRESFRRRVESGGEEKKS